MDNDAFYSFHRCEILTQILNEDDYFKLPWQASLHWLQSEMDRVTDDTYICTENSDCIVCDYFFSGNMLALAITTLDGHHLLSPMRLPMGMYVHIGLIVVPHVYHHCVKTTDESL